MYYLAIFCPSTDTFGVCDIDSTGSLVGAYTFRLSKSSLRGVILSRYCVF